MNFHYFLGDSPDLHWYRYGNLGVQLFFIISGFVIVLSLQGKTIKEFVKNRFIRLFPLFWIICTATYLITLVIPNAKPRLFAEYLSSMTMLGDQFNGYAGFGGLIDASYWTLAVELIFYIGIGLFVLLCSYKYMRYLLFCWLALSIITVMFNIDNNYYIKLALVHHASYFVFGGALALIISNQSKGLFEKYFDWGLLLGSAIYSTVIIHKIYHPYLSPHYLDPYFVTIINALLFLCVGILVKFSNRIKDPLFINILIILGGLTYPLYLLHQTLGTTFINYLSDLNVYSRYFITISFEGIIILTSYIVFVYDKKMRWWLQNKLD